ncbi:MAG: aldo/keto reductase [Culicoidibacterales bacterium]
MMQRIELTDEMSIARMIIDLTSFFGEQPTTQLLTTYFEMSIEAGWDTFLIPTSEQVLAIIEDVLLQRPYLKKQLHFICVITPQQEESCFVNTTATAIITESKRIYEQLEQPKIALGIIDVNDTLFDPVAVITSCQTLVEKQIIASFAVKNSSCEQAAMLSHYSEGGMTAWYQKWRSDFFSNERQVTALFANQLLPLLQLEEQFSIVQQREKLAELAATYRVSTAAIELSWLLQHPVNVLPIVSAMSAKKWRQAYQEQLDFQLTREQWYQLC